MILVKLRSNVKMCIKKVTSYLLQTDIDKEISIGKVQVWSLIVYSFPSRKLNVISYDCTFHNKAGSFHWTFPLSSYKIFHLISDFIWTSYSSKNVRIRSIFLYEKIYRDWDISNNCYLKRLFQNNSF